MSRDDPFFGLGEEEYMRRLHALTNASRKEILAVCEKHGYGRVMQEASEAWEQRQPGTAHIVGPCSSFTEPCECVKQHGHPIRCDLCYGCGWQFKMEPR